MVLLYMFQNKNSLYIRELKIVLYGYIFLLKYMLACVFVFPKAKERKFIFDQSFRLKIS